MSETTPPTDMLDDPTFQSIKHLVTERAIQGETMLLNMGPQHPSTHGVLRLLLELDGEIVVSCIPDVGFLHTGIEKTMESRPYQQAEVATDRIDYMNNMGGNLTYCLAVEKLVGLDVPPRAQALRVILTEMQRIGSHLLWLGTSALDLAAMSVFLYGMREREMILDVFELISGQRMMTTFIRPGGVWREVPVEFEAAVRKFIDIMPRRLDEYESMLTKNPLFLERTQGIGLITAEQCVRWGITGPILRASGRPFDIRKAQPYSGYDQYDFDIPTTTTNDIYGRYLVRVAEMRESINIIRQALDRMPYGPVRSNNRKFVPPPRSELSYSMEAVIHHFKLWTEGFSAPKGSVLVSTESPRGQLCIFMEGNGGPRGQRIYYRGPTFANLQIMPLLSTGHFVADIVGIIGSIDIVLGDCDR